jgi:hypothetical protein
MIVRMRQHPVSIATSFAYEVPIDVQLRGIAEAGFTHFSIGADEAHSGYLTIEGRRRLRLLAHTHVLAIDTIHGPRANRPASTAAGQQMPLSVQAAQAAGRPVPAQAAGHSTPPQAARHQIPMPAQAATDSRHVGPNGPGLGSDRRS